MLALSKNKARLNGLQVTDLYIDILQATEGSADNGTAYQSGIPCTKDILSLS